MTDHYHYWEESGNGYLQSFQQTELVRGHEHDNRRVPVPPGEPVPAWVENVERWRPGAGRGYYANVRELTSEDDFFPARVMDAAARRLDDSPPSPFFLQIESFDVHEPFHVPEPYRSAYGDLAGYNRFTVCRPTRIRGRWRGSWRAPRRKSLRSSARNTARRSRSWTRGSGPCWTLSTAATSGGTRW